MLRAYKNVNLSAGFAYRVPGGNHMKIVVCLMLVFACLLAADTTVAGKWSGSFLMSENGGGQSKDSTIFMVLKQEGSEITGTAGPNEDEQSPITKGKIEGNKLTMDVQTGGPLIHFDLVLDGDHLKGDAHASHEGQSLSAKVDAARAK